MPTETSRPPYALGSTDAEHNRLIRQAAIFNPTTERLLCDAGVGSGQRVLDIGSGVGDVSMLAARLVGPSGKVIGIDKDAGTIAKAKDRVGKGGLKNISFIESDLDRFPGGEPFDAIVGRLILMYVPDPSVVIESLAKSLRPGGVLAIQDAFWGPLLELSSNLPLRSKCAALIYQAFERSGANMNMERVLHRAFQGAGLPPPALRLEVPAGADPGLARWVYDIFCSLLPRMQHHNLPLGEIGEMATLEARLDAELASARMFGATIGLIGAWSRKAGPIDQDRVE